MEYGKWKVLQHGKRFSLCICQCGTEKKIRTQYLINGRSKGCFKCRQNRWSLEDINERFYRLNLKQHEGKMGCWIFDGFINNGGYGMVAYKIKPTLAHRASWIYHNGEIKGNLKVCHKCDNPSCINPSHLFLGTQSDNIADMRKKGRDKFLKGIDHPMSKVNVEQAKEIISTYANGYLSQKQIANKFGLSKNVVGRIINKKHHLTRS